jgi:hypothetical protein
MVADFSRKLGKWLAEKPAPVKIAGMQTPAYAYVSDEERKQLLRDAPGERDQ